MSEKDMQKNDKAKSLANSTAWSYKQYIEIIDKYVLKFKDTREINFQNDVIKPFLDALCSCFDDIAVVNTSTQYRNRKSKAHDRSKYANISTPDLLIARNWHYDNMNSDDIEYLVLVEIKSPKGDFNAYQISDYLSKVPKVIFTNCYKWNFYEKHMNGKIQHFDLVDENNNWKMKSEREYDSDEWENLCKYILDFIAGNV